MVVERSRVLSLFDSGIAALEAQASFVTDAMWDAPACGEWSTLETARHVLAVSRWYHRWLDRAMGGEITRPFDGADIDRYNSQELARLQDMGGREAIGGFAESARAYLKRLPEEWNRPFAYPFGLVTAGLHAGVAAAEWHLHAWDISQVTGRLHRPGDPEGLFLAAGACVAEATGGVRAALMAAIVPLAAKRKPWESMVKRSGRRP